jgi:hypothetical protein
MKLSLGIILQPPPPPSPRYTQLCPPHFVSINLYPSYTRIERLRMVKSQAYWYTHYITTYTFFTSVIGNKSKIGEWNKGCMRPRFRLLRSTCFHDTFSQGIISWRRKLDTYIWWLLISSPHKKGASSHINAFYKKWTTCKKNIIEHVYFCLRWSISKHTLLAFASFPLHTSRRSILVSAQGVPWEADIHKSRNSRTVTPEVKLQSLHETAIVPYLDSDVSNPQTHRLNPFPWHPS